MTICRYAAYGSNLHPYRLQQRVASARFIGTSVLQDHLLCFHKRGFHDGSGKCNIVPGDGVVYFAIYAVDRSDKDRLDAIEGLGHGYKDHAVELPDFGMCQTYVADQSAIDDALKPIDWYREMVILGCQHHSFPDDYIHAIKTVAVVSDADAENSSKQWQLVRDMRTGHSTG